MRIVDNREIIIYIVVQHLHRTIFKLNCVNISLSVII